MTLVPTGSDTWLVSSNPFDVIGAISAGMCAAWVKPTPDALFDSWGGVVQEENSPQHWIPAFAGMTTVSYFIGPEQ